MKVLKRLKRCIRCGGPIGKHGYSLVEWVPDETTPTHESMTIDPRTAIINMCENCGQEINGIN